MLCYIITYLLLSNIYNFLTIVFINGRTIQPNRKSVFQECKHFVALQLC